MNYLDYKVNLKQIFKEESQRRKAFTVIMQMVKDVEKMDRDKAWKDCVLHFLNHYKVTRIEKYL